LETSPCTKKTALWCNRHWGELKEVQEKPLPALRGDAFTEDYSVGQNPVGVDMGGGVSKEGVPIPWGMEDSGENEGKDCGKRPPRAVVIRTRERVLGEEKEVEGQTHF